MTNKEIKGRKRELKITTRGAEETKNWGERLGRLLPAGALVCLRGELGTGKTCFIQGLAKGVGVKNYQYVASPTFVMMMEHKGHFPFYHFDLYRLEEPEELREMGCLDYVYGNGITAVEWAEKAENILTGERIDIFIERIDDNERSLKFRATGKKPRAIIQTLSKI